MTHYCFPRVALTAAMAAGCVLIGGCTSPAATPAQPTSAEPIHQSATQNSASSSTGSAAPSTVPQNRTSTENAVAASLAPATSGGSTDACSLLTEQDAAAALGSDPGPGQQTSLLGAATACTYLASDSSLQLSFTPSGGKATFDQEFAQLPTAAAAAGTVTTLDGIGDHAFGQFQGTRGAINFDKGDALVVVGLNLAGVAEPPRSQIIVLATTAAGRI